MGASLLGFFPLANYFASFLTSDWTQSRPEYACTSFCQDGSQCKASLADWRHLWWDNSPPLTPKEPFSSCAVKASLSPRRGNMCPPYFSPKQCFGPSLPQHYCLLKVSTGDRVQLFILFLLSFLSWNINRRLVVSPFISCLRIACMTMPII